MKAKIIDGKLLSENIKNELAIQASDFQAKYGRKIGLAVVLAGEDPASKIYVRNKIIACEKVGISSYEYRLPETASESEVIDVIEKINADRSIDGLIVQLPLPNTLDSKKILTYVNYEKDVDGFHALNTGNMLIGNDCLLPCTPAGIIKLIESTGEKIAGKHAVVVGRSNIVGKPTAVLLLQNNATVTIAHSKTENLSDMTLQADILVAAVGKKEFITGDMIKNGAIVIDVGMNRENNKLYGDVNYNEAVEKASYITPVPGGVGPMTIAMLLNNTVKAAYRAKQSIDS